MFIQSIFTALITLILTKNSWFPFILFITFTGGLIIIFIYISRIASNEKFKFSLKLLIYSILILIILLIVKDLNLLFSNKWIETTLNIQNNEEKYSIIKFLISNKKLLSTLLIFVILLTLISVTNIVNSFEGPLKKTYENIYS